MEVIKNQLKVIKNHRINPLIIKIDSFFNYKQKLGEKIILTILPVFDGKRKKKFDKNECTNGLIDNRGKKNHSFFQLQAFKQYWPTERIQFFYDITQLTTKVSKV